MNTTINSHRFRSRARLRGLIATLALLVFVAGVPTVLARVSGLVQQQAAMIAYLDDFWLMVLVTLASAPIVFMLRRPKHAPAKPDPAHAMAE